MGAGGLPSRWPYVFSLLYEKKAHGICYSIGPSVAWRLAQTMHAITAESVPEYLTTRPRCL